MTPPAERPIVRIATLCEKAELNEGVLTLNRVVDRLIVRASGEDAPEAMPTYRTEMDCVIAIYAGPVRGEHQIGIRFLNPAGVPTPGPEDATARFEKETDQKQWLLHLQLEVADPGVYWVEVLFDGELLTRLPWHVVYRREPIPSTSPTPPGDRTS